MSKEPRWYQELLADKPEPEPKHKLEPFHLYKATTRQTGAMRELAREWGFKDLRDFRKFMMEVDKTYYDIIKMASPE